WGLRNFQRSSVRGGDAQRDRESKPGALPHVLRREEWLEDATAQLQRNPRPIVDHFEPVRALAGMRAYDDPPGRVADGVLGVQDEVQDDLLDLLAIDDDRKRAGSQLELKSDVPILQMVLAQHRDPACQFVEIRLRAPRSAAADERKKI